MHVYLRVAVPVTLCVALVVAQLNARLFASVCAVSLAAVAVEPLPKRSFLLAMALWCVAAADPSTWSALVSPRGNAFGLVAGLLSPLTAWFVRPSLFVSYVVAVGWCLAVSLEEEDGRAFGNAAQVLMPFGVVAACATGMAFFTLNLAKLEGVAAMVRLFVAYYWIGIHLVLNVDAQELLWAAGAMLTLCTTAYDMKQQIVH